TKGYAELEQSGLIYCVQGKGCFVGSVSRLGDMAHQPSSDWHLSVIDYLPRAQVWKYFQAPISETKYRFHMSEVQHELLPNEEIGRNLHRLIMENPSVIAQYGPFQGDDELRQALAGYFTKRRIRADARDVL